MAQIDKMFEHESSLSVERGLYLLRYASAADAGAAPTATVRIERGSELDVEIISAPGASVGHLAGPGAGVVVRAERRGAVTISVRRLSLGESLEASFRLEPLSVPAEPALAPSTSQGGAPSTGAGDVPAPSPIDVTVMGHLARRGDVAAGSGLWLGGPVSPAPIEGLEIRGTQRSGASVEMQVLVATRPPRWLDWVPSGVFAGSRGRALPLAGVRLRLVGPETEAFELSVDALFLGSAILSRRGREIEVVSSAGADPLIGLRVSISPEASGAGNEPAVAARRQREPRVRVFRASVNS